MIVTGLPLDILYMTGPLAESCVSLHAGRHPPPQDSAFGASVSDAGRDAPERLNYCLWFYVNDLSDRRLDKFSLI